jgi:hypothetical protein
MVMTETTQTNERPRPRVTGRGRNHRPLDDIAADIHKLHRGNVFATGDLLIEAKDQQLDHGEFLDWIDAEFDWSKTTAERYMNAARLKAKFPNLGNLKLAKTTIYELAELMAADTADELMESIIAALAEKATRNQLKATAASAIIKEHTGGNGEDEADEAVDEADDGDDEESDTADPDTQADDRIDTILREREFEQADRELPDLIRNLLTRIEAFARDSTDAELREKVFTALSDLQNSALDGFPEFDFDRHGNVIRLDDEDQDE